MTMRVYGVRQRPGKEQMRPDFVFVEDQEDNVVLRKAWHDVYTAVELWGLIDSQHSKDMLRFMKEQVEANADDEGEATLSVAQTKQLLSYVEGLDTAILQITDRHWRLQPEHVALAVRQVPDLVTTWQQPDGTMVYTLENIIVRVISVADFLREAIRIGRGVSID